ncbi:MAG: thiosulfate oxidation carrier protein SoxY [Planctomycetota bacterium]|jgi:sulfur-oxidizing protein SoxY
MSQFNRSAGVSRRRFIVLTGGVVLAGAAGLPTAWADQKLLDEAVAKVAGGRAPGDGSGIIKLELPEIAENGNTVPLRIEVESPMTADNYVKHVHVFADGNPRPDVASFHFSPASGKAAASTRMRLAKTQNIVAVAEMNDGKVVMAKKEVKVTIGGCGG